MRYVKILIFKISENKDNILVVTKTQKRKIEKRKKTENLRKT